MVKETDKYSWRVKETVGERNRQIFVEWLKKQTNIRETLKKQTNIRGEVKETDKYSWRG